MKEVIAIILISILIPTIIWGIITARKELKKTDELLSKRWSD